MKHIKSVFQEGFHFKIETKKSVGENTPFLVLWATAYKDGKKLIWPINYLDGRYSEKDVCSCSGIIHEDNLKRETERAIKDALRYAKKALPEIEAHEKSLQKEKAEKERVKKEGNDFPAVFRVYKGNEVDFVTTEIGFNAPKDTKRRAKFVKEFKTLLKKYNAE